MNNSGSADAPDESAPHAVGNGVPLKVILILALALLLALVVGLQVIGVLYAILFPPSPPVPAAAQLQEHINSAYGTDEWLYTIDQPACEVTLYFETQAPGSCQVSLGACESGATAPDTMAVGVPQNIARCASESRFSLFALRWEAIIATDPDNTAATLFRVQREVFWTGAVPPQNQIQP